MLVLANVTWDGLVADDYYRRGLQINRSLARDAEAARLGLRAFVEFPAPGIVTIRLVDPDGAASAPGTDNLNLRFARAARTGADVTVAMSRDTGEFWQGHLPPMTSGKWYVELGNDQWRLISPVWMPVVAGEFALRTEAGAD